MISIVQNGQFLITGRHHMVHTKVEQCMNYLKVAEKHSPDKFRQISKLVKCSYKTAKRASLRLLEGDDMLSITIRETMQLRSELLFLYNLMNTKYIPLVDKKFDAMEREFIKMLDERYEGDMK